MFPLRFYRPSAGIPFLSVIFLTILRQVILFAPLAWLLSFWGLSAVWWTFPCTDGNTAIVSLLLYQKDRRKLMLRLAHQEDLRNGKKITRSCTFQDA